MNGAAQLSMRKHEDYPSRFRMDEERSSFREQDKPSAQTGSSGYCPAVFVFRALHPAPEEPTARRRRRMGCTVATAGHAAVLLLLWPLHMVRTRVMVPPSAVTVDMEPPSGMSSIEAPSVSQHAATSVSRQKQPVRKTTAPSPAIPVMEQARPHPQDFQPSGGAPSNPECDALHACEEPSGYSLQRSVCRDRAGIGWSIGSGTRRLRYRRFLFIE